MPPLARVFVRMILLPISILPASLTCSRRFVFLECVLLGRTDKRHVNVLSDQFGQCTDLLAVCRCLDTEHDADVFEFHNELVHLRESERAQLFITFEKSNRVFLECRREGELVDLHAKIDQFVGLMIDGL